tara:strand:- start:18332 stop:18544 length:213 start_codon:yes stop_codon:yes gene_type:complete
MLKTIVGICAALFVVAVSGLETINSDSMIDEQEISEVEYFLTESDTDNSEVETLSGMTFKERPKNELLLE